MRSEKAIQMEAVRGPTTALDSALDLEPMMRWVELTDAETLFGQTHLTASFGQTHLIDSLAPKAPQRLWPRRIQSPTLYSNSDQIEQQ